MPGPPEQAAVGRAIAGPADLGGEPAGDAGGYPVRSRIVALCTGGLWLLGLVMLAAISALALFQLAVYSKQEIVGLDLARIAWLVVGSVVATGAWAVVLWNRSLLRTHPLSCALAVLAVTRVAEIATVPSPLQSDFLRYHDLAIQISQHGLTLDAVPTGYPTLLAAVYALFGAQVFYAQLLNVVIAGLTAALLFDMTRRLWSRRAATFAVWLFVLAPAQILMTGVLATEAPYGLLLLFAIWISVRLQNWPIVASLAIGVVLAASCYVRATTPSILPAFMLLPFLAPAVRLPRAALGSAAILGVFLVCLIPVVIWNEDTRGELSISPSYYGGWSLLIGTDPANGGQYNSDLIAAVGETPGTPAFDKKAGELAIERLKAKPLQFLELAVKKFPRMWANENYGVSFTLGWLDNPDRNEQQTLLLFSQLAYVATVLLALGGLWWMRRALPGAVVAVLGVMLILFAVHSFLEVQSRYHAYMVPMWCMLAGVGAEQLRPGRLAKQARQLAVDRLGRP